MIKLYEELPMKEQKSIHCLPLLGKFAEKYELYGMNVNDKDVIEINTNRDWEFANLIWSD